MKNLTEVVNRQYFLDWIRVFAMVGVFFFHNARIFDAFSDWHVKNATISVAATGLVSFMSQWMMPLFFLISGAGIFYALRSRNTGKFVQERVLRLLVPLVFGMLVIVVPQAYFDALSHGELTGEYSFFQIYGLYLQSLPDLNYFHLWFLVDLFLFSIITIPLFFFRNKEGKSLISRLASYLDKPWALLPLFIVSITIVNIFIYPDGFWGYRNGGWNIINYLFFFIFGYLIFANPRIMPMIRKLRWISLGTGFVGFITIVIGVFVLGIDDAADVFGSPVSIGTTLLQSLAAWGWLLAILGFGSKYLNRNNRFLSHANEAVLPFYILHQTIIVIIGFYVIQWSTGVGTKYLVISSASFVGIMLIYELLVRHFNVLRFLFGMKLRIKSSVTVATGNPNQLRPGRLPES
jgi:glucans biosynthesis protein C